MRDDMDKISARNQELIKEAESRTGWFAAAGLGIVLAGVGLGLLGRRGAKKASWRDNLESDGSDADAASFAPPPVAAGGARGGRGAEGAATPVPSYRIGSPTPSPIST